MKTPIAVLVSLFLGLAVCGSGQGQQPGPLARLLEMPPCDSPSGAAHGPHRTQSCFPRCGCPDDYCPRPYPRPCPPPYPPFYQCVPAGDCGHAPVGSHERDRLTWWFLPTPRALADAIWCQPGT